jgi:isopenicillin N synthase-like dioxygenase
VPHTDSDFLTVLCQDQVGGLQLMKDARWVAVKPHPDALIVNIGDLFQVTVRRLPPRATGASCAPYVLQF